MPRKPKLLKAEEKILRKRFDELIEQNKEDSEEWELIRLAIYFEDKNKFLQWKIEFGPDIGPE